MENELLIIAKDTYLLGEEDGLRIIAKKRKDDWLIISQSLYKGIWQEEASFLISSACITKLFYLQGLIIIEENQKLDKMEE